MDQSGLVKKSIVIGKIWEDGKHLFVEIDVDCQICGPGRLVLPGHHVLQILDILKTAAEKHPELVKIERTQTIEMHPSEN